MSAKSLQDYWRQVEASQTTPERCLKNLQVLQGHLQQQPDSLQASQVQMQLCEWLRSQPDATLFERGFSILEKLKPVSCVPLLVDMALADNVVLLENAMAELNARKKSAKSSSSPPELPAIIGNLQFRAVRLIGKIGDSRAVIPLMSLLNNKQQNYRLRMAAAESLGRLGDTHAVDALMGVLRNEDESSVYLKESSAKALGMLGDLRAVDALMEVLNSKQGLRNKMNFLKERAIQAIGNLFKETPVEYSVVDSLVLALNDDAASIRQAAAEAIGALGDPKMVEVLLPKLKDRNAMVVEAVVASIYELEGGARLQVLMLDEDLPKRARDEIKAYLSDDDDDDWDDDDE